MNLVEVESKISVLESTRDNIALRANADILPLETQLHRIQIGATEQLARIDGQLAVLKDLRAELLPKPEVAPAVTTSGDVGTTPDPVPDSVA